LQQALGIAAAACESDAVYNLLVSNPTMPDGQALFSTAHGNLMPAADLTATSLAAASAALAAQTAADGRALHLAAKYLVVGTLLGTEARQLVTTMTPANTPPDTGFVVVEDGRIPGKSWYLMTDQWPTIATAHLAATGGPELLAMDGWDIDGRLYKARDEFGCTVMDWRSMIYTPAAP
jgi:Mu-like prophage major head subunit gpT